MFHPPPDDPFIDSSGFALEAIFEDESGSLGAGYIGSLSPRAVMATIELDDGTFAGVVQFQRRESDPLLWDPLLMYDGARGQWETIPPEHRRPYRIVVGLIGRGMLEQPDEQREDVDE